jgi:hypothetical protein
LPTPASSHDIHLDLRRLPNHNGYMPFQPLNIVERTYAITSIMGSMGIAEKEYGVLRLNQ